MRTFIYCSGSHGRVVLDILLRLNKKYINFIDDVPVKNVIDYNVYSFDYIVSQDIENVEIIIANGSPVIRKKIFLKLKKYGFNFINAIDKSAVVIPSAYLGVDNTIGINAIVNSGSLVGSHCIINNGAVLEHDCSIEDFATICPGCQIGGKSIISHGAFICTGAIILPRVKIGRYSVVAAGSVVTKDIPDNTFVMGSPAKKVRDVDRNFNWNKLL